MLSGYPSALYDDLLDGWRSLELQVMNQGGVRTEKLWFNFTVDRVHWASYAGKNFTDRQRIKRKAANWARRYQALPRAERLAVLAAMMAVEVRETSPILHLPAIRRINRSCPASTKQSLREEFDTLKAQFERLCAEGKMGSESRALFQAMLMLFELLMAVFMERRTTKDSNNSSKPSSQTHEDDTAASRPGAKGKGKAQNNARSGNTRTVETVQVAQVHVCETCGEDLEQHPL